MRPSYRSKGNKYRNHKVTTLDGLTFDSEKELRRYKQLQLLERAGLIRNLERQVEFQLVPNQRINGRVVERAINYVADFVYTDTTDESRVVEDVKGFKTPEYIIKRKLMLYFYNIRIMEV